MYNLCKAVTSKIVAPLAMGFVLLTWTDLASATLIDTFIDGTIPGITAPPFQSVDQSGLSGVIGSGDRNLLWQVTSGPGTAKLDLNSTVLGEALLSSSGGTAGHWLFSYGVDSPMNVDLTDGGLSSAVIVTFSAASAGQLNISVIDTNGGVALRGVVFPAMPAGGELVEPFALFSTNSIDPFADFTHAKQVHIEITGSAGGTYGIQSFTTPEPSSIALMALGTIGLFCFARRQRE
jgi:hypothetical protein